MKRSRLRGVPKWLAFRHKGRALAKISTDGLFMGEIGATKELLAYRQGVRKGEIKVVGVDA